MSNRNSLSPIKEEEEFEPNDELNTVPPNDSLLFESKGLLEDGDEPDLIWLKDTKHKNLYMAKVGMIFTIHFLIWVLGAVLVIFDDTSARLYYWLFKLYLGKWMYVLYFIIIRLVFAFGSESFRGFSKLFYILDIPTTFLGFLGMYYYFNEFLKTQYIYNGHYLIILAFCSFFNSIGFTLSCLIKDKKRNYNYIAGFIIMELTTFAGIYLSTFFIDIPTMTETKYRIVFIIISVFNLYGTTNAYFILKYRGMKFYDYEHISCYFCFWTDWLYVYWRDATRKYRAKRARLEEEFREEKRDKKDDLKASNKKANEIKNQNDHRELETERNNRIDGDNNPENMTMERDVEAINRNSENINKFDGSF